MTLAARPIYMSMAFAVALMAIGLLVAGKNLLIPLAVSVMIWYILNALATAFDRIHFGMLHLPGWLRMTLAIISVFLAIALLVEMISNNIADVQRAAPDYQVNLEKIIDRVAAAFGFEQAPSVAQVADQINFGDAMRNFGSAIAGFAGGAGIILVYVMFLLIEQQTFDKKMRGVVPRSGARGAGPKAAAAHAETDPDLYLDQDADEPGDRRRQLRRAHRRRGRPRRVLGVHHISA